MAKQQNGKYDDIIYLPHHVSTTRPRISPEDRAAQFSPFAALTGYDAVISETGRLTDSRVELSEDRKAELDKKQRQLTELLGQRPKISVTYFVCDERKPGGEYVTVTGSACKLDTYYRLLLLTDGTEIPLDDILDMEI